MRDSIDWILGQDERSLRGGDPTQTVLTYLRETERRIGTKEGCAEGDCGACTVVLGEPDGAGGMRYRPVNACILPLGALDGKQLLTVEDLRDPDGDLHPVQQAMVDCHASQCGFCTPGFVMAAFALFHSGIAATRPAINDALAGNLCRCTGYRPIVDATAQACAGARQDRFSAGAASVAARLGSLQDRPALAAGDGTHRFLAPRNLDELAAVRKLRPDAPLLAGGTDIGVWIAKQHREFATMISLQAVEELRALTQDEAGISIGAAVPYEDALAVLADAYPDFAALVRRIGSQQIRARGTIGGNIANGSPIGDTMPALIALDATLVLHDGPDRRRVKLEDFFLGYRQTALRPTEFIERIDIPRLLPGQMFAAYKLSKRFDQDISAVCAAFRLTLDGGAVADIRIAYGGMAATPVRLRRVEQALKGAAWTETAIRTAMREMEAECQPISDMRASAAYRRQAAGNLLLKFFLETSGTDAARTRLAPNCEIAA